MVLLCGGRLSTISAAFIAALCFRCLQAPERREWRNGLQLLFVQQNLGFTLYLHWSNQSKQQVSAIYILKMENLTTSAEICPMSCSWKRAGSYFKANLMNFKNTFWRHAFEKKIKVAEPLWVDSAGVWWCLWSKLEPKTMWMFRIGAAAWSHVDVHRPCCCQGPYWYEWRVLSPVVIVLSRCCHWGSRRVHGSMTAGMCIDVCSPYYHQMTYGNPWPVLQPEVMLVSVGHATTEGHIDVGGLYCYLRW